jgi:hypothetical protein
MLAGPQTALSWVYPLAWARNSARASNQTTISASDPVEADSYAGLLKGIALGSADAGFIPEGFFLGVADGVLAARVRIVARTEAYPLNLLVSRTDLVADRKAVAQQLQGLYVAGLGISAPDMQALRMLDELRKFMAQAEVPGVPEP